MNASDSFSKLPATTSFSDFKLLVIVSGSDSKVPVTVRCSIQDGCYSQLSDSKGLVLSDSEGLVLSAVPVLSGLYCVSCSKSK